MCQDCYSPGSYADDDLGYDDQDDDWGDDGYYADELDDSHYDEDDGDDRYEEFKDGVAMGYLNPDGSQREPDPPDGYDPWDYRLSRRERFWRVLRTLLPRRRVVINRERYDDEPPFLGGERTEPMATGPEHYREAERLLADADPPHEESKWDTALIAAAQVHATLALAAATALEPSACGSYATDLRAWRDAAGVPDPSVTEVGSA